MRAPAVQDSGSPRAALRHLPGPMSEIGHKGKLDRLASRTTPGAMTAGTYNFSHLHAPPAVQHRFTHVFVKPVKLLPLMTEPLDQRLQLVISKGQVRGNRQMAAPSKADLPSAFSGYTSNLIDAGLSARAKSNSQIYPKRMSKPRQITGRAKEHRAIIGGLIAGMPRMGSRGCFGTAKKSANGLTTRGRGRQKKKVGGIGFESAAPTIFIGPKHWGSSFLIGGRR